MRNYLDSALIIPAGAASDYAGELKSGMEFILEAKAKQTSKTYLSALTSFHAWAENRKVCDLPAKPETVLAYLSYLGGTPRSRSYYGVSQAALAWANEVAVLSSPITHVVRLAFSRSYASGQGAGPYVGFSPESLAYLFKLSGT